MTRTACLNRLRGAERVASLCLWPCQSAVGCLLGLEAAWSGVCVDWGGSPTRSWCCPCALCRERALSAQARHPELLRVLPCLAQPSLQPPSPHCPLLPAGIFIALLLRFDIR